MLFITPHRRGVTLVELLLFLGLISIVIGVILPIVFSANENRLLQQTIATVEQSGAQSMQNIALRIRQGERILSPALGQTGSVLTLQTGSGNTNPTIIGVSSGSLVIIRRATREVVSSSQVAIENFMVRNVSASASHQGVTVSFKVTRTIRLQQPHSYVKFFEGAFTLLPDDTTIGDDCGCAAPTCEADDIYQWEVCNEGACITASSSLQCP